MISALFVAYAVLQVSAPTLPPGVTPEFQADILRVEKLLSNGSFDEASKHLSAMPATKLAFSWDDSAVPANQREALLKARSLAFAAWKSLAPELEFAPTSNAGLRISFTAKNHVSATSKMPEAVVYQKTGEATVAIISLTRGATPAPATAADLQNSIAQAVGVYLGVQHLPFMLSTMTRQDASVKLPSQLSRLEAGIAQQNIAAVQALRQAASSKQKLAVTSSQVTLPIKAENFGKILQGNTRDFDLQLRNEGNGEAKVWIKPDCGCLTVPGIQTIAPNEILQVPINFNSHGFNGPIHKKLYVVSNDPTQPLQTFEFDIEVNPMYRFLSPNGSFVVVDEDGGEGEVFLTFTEVEPFAIKSVLVNGIQGTAEREEWQGSLPDPERNEPAIARKGYRFRVKFPGSLPPGRSPSTLTIVTDSKVHPVVQHNFFVQKGIVALPDQLFLGEMIEAKLAKVLVSRPGKAFKILSAKSDSAHLKVAISPTDKPDEFAISVQYDGKAPSGAFNQVITFATDDPSQPTVTMPVFGTVR